MPGFGNENPARRWIWILAILCLSLFLLTPVAIELVGFWGGGQLYARLARQRAKLALPPPMEHTAIVVLTGDQLRIPRAIELLRETGVPALIISGTARSTTLAELLNLQDSSLVRIQDIWSKIILEQNATSTLANARETARLARERQFRRLVLVTSDYHMRRSLVAFRLVSQDLNIIPYPVESSATGLFLRESYFSWEGVYYLWTEYVKSLALKVRIYFERTREV